MEAIENLEDRVRSFQDDVTSSSSAANGYLDNISLKVDALHENLGALHHDLIQWKLEAASAQGRQITQIKWLLAALLVLLLWRFF